MVYELPDKAELFLGDTEATYNYIHGNIFCSFVNLLFRSTCLFSQNSKVLVSAQCLVGLSKY